jgi:outer membrane lipoprotein-sorting protein
MRKISAIVLILNCLAALAAGQQLSPGDVKSLLGRVREKRAGAPGVQADFREERVVRLMSKPIVTTGHVWFEQPSKFRREVKGNSPSISASDGHQLWIYYPNFKSAEHYVLGQHSPVDAVIAAINTALNLENVENSFQVTGEKNSGGYALQLLPQTQSMKRMFQKFEVQLNNDLHVSRTDMLQPNGDRIVTTYSNQSRAPIPGATFQYAPPPGTEVTRPLGR